MPEARCQGLGGLFPMSFLLKPKGRQRVTICQSVDQAGTQVLGYPEACIQYRLLSAAQGPEGEEEAGR